ncbi:NAD(P)/FAD-dependent oxidoreductase [uncultured Abyssibacter sp.]|uniref:NAD(P)/FAD-dependent oxidoreductase n=1 Tax=uncultured Abyssibacter sp. TaxID=2320202 RepID=UPI0032B190F7
MAEPVECVVVGAGVIGLAVARALARQGRETLILEREAQFGTVTSARNSEVIHAGIYYPAGSLKATLCVRGKAQLYAYCERNNVPHRRCGKLIVATDASQESELESIRRRAAANGVDDLRRLSAAEARALEPALHCTAALLSPSTGIIDSHAYMLSLLGQAETAGAMLACHTTVSRLVPTGRGIEVFTEDADRPALIAQVVVNAAGLDAPALAARTDRLPEARRPRAWFAKGSYFTLRGRAPFSRLVYPVPEPGGLGVHLTLDLAGQARFGPDVEWVDAPDYQVDPARGAGFEAAIRHYWPALDAARLEPAYAGVRPKIAGPGEPAADFRISGPGDHGIPGLVNLFGIESPGLTASLALADNVANAVAVTF